MRKPGFSIALLIFIFGNYGHSLTLEDVSFELSTHEDLVALDVNYITTVKTGEITFSTKTHQISNGQDKVWMEVSGPNVNQRIIRNGNNVKVTDLGSGKSETTSEPTWNDPSAILGNFNISPAKYKAPINVEDSDYKIMRKEGTDSSLTSEVLIYNADLKKIISIVSVANSGDSTVTHISYCTSCKFLIPQKIEVYVIPKIEARSDVVIEYSNFIFPKKLTEAVFKID